jgi:multidrug efflux system outer membrane protein
MRRFILLITVAALASGCNVGKKYVRPKVDVPAEYRTETVGTRLSVTPSSPSKASLADMKWFEVFKDPQLQELVRAALVNNYDLRETVARVNFARGQLGVTRADQYPNVNGGAELLTERASRSGAQEIPEPFQVSRTFGSVALGLLTFELDIWGRLRNATEADRNRLLAEEENQKAVVVTLVASVAAGYYSLRELDLELEIAQRTLDSRRESLRIIQLQEGAGIATMLDVRQAQELLQQAATSIPDIRRSIGLQENFLATLVGANPREIVRGAALEAQQMPPDVPTGLTSDLIERRPDILAAERLLAAANAEVGVAKAAYFPRISLTGLFGFQSDQLSSLFTGPSRIWSFRPVLDQPIFQAGRLKGNLRIAKANREFALVEYERAVQNGFREVSDALISYQNVREQRAEQERLVEVLRDRVRLANLRYEGGVDLYLAVLDAERELFDQELELARVRLDEVTTVVTLYKALGGGWEL